MDIPSSKLQMTCSYRSSHFRLNLSTFNGVECWGQLHRETTYVCKPRLSCTRISRHSKKGGYYNETSSGGRHIDGGQTSPTVPRGRLALWSLEASYPASHSDSTTFAVYNPETFSHLPIVLGFSLCSEHKT